MELLVSLIFSMLIWIFHVKGAPPSNTISASQETCVLSLTIPKDSIKSNCNMNEEVLRKMHSMEAQFSYYKTQLGSLEIRLPEVVMNMNKYNDKVEQLELVIAKESTYYKHMEDRINTLEEAVTTEANSDSQKHIDEPDTLLDPIRPYVMAELQNMRDELRKEILQEISKEKEEKNKNEDIMSIIKPFIHTEMQYVKQEILKSLKNAMTIKILDQNEEIGSTDEITGNIVEDVTKSLDADQLEQNSLVTDQTEEDNMIADQAAKKEDTLLHEMARTIKDLEQNNISLISSQKDFENFENLTKEIENEIKDNEQITANSNVITDNLQKTIDLLRTIAEENLGKDLSEKVAKLSNDFENKFASIDQRINDIVSTLTDDLSKKLNESLGEISQHFSNQNENMKELAKKLNCSITTQKLNESISDMKINIASMDRRIDSYTNDIVLDTKIQTKFENVKSSLELSLLGMKSSLSSYSNRIAQVERQGNLSMTLLNHFKKTLLHHNNESSLNFETLKSEITDMESDLKEEITNKMNTDGLQLQLEGLQTEFMFFKHNIAKLQKNSTSEDKKLEIKVQELSSKTQSMDWQLTSLHDHAQRILEIERNQTLLKNNYDLMRELMKLVHLEQKLRHNRWIEFNFTHHSTKNACHNKQYVKRNNISHNGIGAYVGIQLCTNTRYKMFLGNSLDEDFMDIADQYGHGQDHCQFIGGTTESGVVVETKFPSTMGEKAFLRKQWDEKPHLGYLSFMTPTPSWYECGISLP